MSERYGEARHFPSNDRCDNRLSNLRWDTHRANIADKVEHGTTLRGERSPKAKLTTDKVLAIRAEYSTGDVKQAHIAARHHVTRQLIYRIVNRKCWAHVA